MWEDPKLLWTRLALGREEFLQRIVTTLIVGGEAPPWNSPRAPSDQGRTFLRLLDALAHGAEGSEWTTNDGPQFVDEYLLPKIDEAARNGWPDWAVLWPNRSWVIELKTEAGSHRADQLPYYLQLASAACPKSKIDLTYLTGPLTQPAPALAQGQRYSHLTWDDVLPLIERVWENDDRSEVRAYVDVAAEVVRNLVGLRPADQRAIVIGRGEQTRDGSTPPDPDNLLAIARATAIDGVQRGVGALSAADLEALQQAARSAIAALPEDDATRFVRPWVWRVGQTDGAALTAEGAEFGFELRFSRYRTLQIKP